jgi:hypothetical protein
VAGWWFSPVSSTNKTDHLNITENFLKMALNIITPLFFLAQKLVIRRFGLDRGHENPLQVQIKINKDFLHWKLYLKFGLNRIMFYSGEGFHCIMINILYTILKPRECQEQVTIHLFFNLASKFYRKKFEGVFVAVIIW